MMMTDIERNRRSIVDDALCRARARAPAARQAAVQTVLAFLWFGNQVTPANALGIALVIGGRFRFGSLGALRDDAALTGLRRAPTAAHSGAYSAIRYHEMAAAKSSSAAAAAAAKK